VIKQCDVCDVVEDMNNRGTRCVACKAARACTSCKRVNATQGTSGKCSRCYSKARHCTTCGDEFRGVKSLCNKCRYSASADQRKINWERWAAANPQYRYERSKAHLLKKYGITPKDYHDMHEAAGGVCAICDQPETALDRLGNIRRLSVDHDHETGFIRGLLCAKCNPALGLLNDDPELLRNAITYLEAAMRRQQIQAV
jgi:hypothetical protein